MEFFKELRRRKVIRVALVYVVTAWLLIQIAGEVADPLHLPSWFSTAVIVLLGLGFPVALGLAWAFEVKPEAAVRSENTGSSNEREDELGEHPVTRRSIAVLPFENLSDESSVGHFADGFADEILNRLSALKDLKVASRSSTLAYRDLNQNMKMVGEELGVSYLLEGSVRQAGEELRVTIQLIRAPDDEHIWAQSFEFAVGDGFNAQEKLARTVAHRAHANVLADVSILAARRQTRSARAYRHFRIAAEARWQGPNSDENANFKLIYENFRLAAEIDPEFAAAHEGVANICTFFWALDITREEASRIAHAAMDRSLELRPPSGYSFMILGMVYELDANSPAAREALTKGLAIAPNMAWLHAELAGIAMHEGKAVEALTEIRTAAKLAPGDRRINEMLGMHLFLHNDLEGAISVLDEVLDRVIAGKDYIGVCAWLALSLIEQGNVERANKILDTAMNGSFENNDVCRLAVALANAGRTSDVTHIKSTMMAKHGAEWFPGNRFLLHVAAGELDEAFDYLHQSIDNRQFFDLRLLRTDISFLSPMRADPRWSGVITHLESIEAQTAAGE